MANCGATGCSSLATLSWQRWGTAEEIEYYHGTGDLPMSETTARLAVHGCDLHKISDDLSTQTHDSTCGAPPTCDCSVSG